MEECSILKYEPTSIVTSLSLPKSKKIIHVTQQNIKYREVLAYCAVIIETLGLFAEEYEVCTIVNDALEYIELTLKEET